MKETVVAVKGFCKRYKGIAAVKDVSFDVKRGEIFGILGPNGAGKTTLLESIEGIRTPDDGCITVLGLNPHRDMEKLKNRIGIQLQVSSLPGTMTVSEAMKLFCLYHKVKPRTDLIERVDLGEKLKAQYQTLSTGQQRRLSLAMAVAYDPELLFLDEPTAGLDVQSRIKLHEIMNELKENGTTIILATHDMAEAEKMADRVAILVKGRIAACGSPRELTSIGNDRTRISINTERGVFTQLKPTFPSCSLTRVDTTYAVYFSTDPAASITSMLGYLNEQSDVLVDLRVERPTLEERFLEITVEGGRS